MKFELTVFCHPEPQGSVRAFTPKGWTRPVLTSTNKHLKTYRNEVSNAAFGVTKEVIFPDKDPVSMRLKFYFAKPASVPKKRIHPAVKPDLSKLIRSTEDALSGIVYKDDAQVVSVTAVKLYGEPERVEIACSLFEGV